MSDSDKMRAEFEAWASVEGYSLRKYTQTEFEAFAKADGLDVLRWLDFSSSYIDSETTAAEHGYEAGYQAGRKAERETIFIEWENGEILAAEVERLRAELAETKRWLDERSDAYGKTCSMVDQLQAELAAARNQNRNDTEAITEQALRVLDSSEVDGDSDSVPPTVLELVELMADAAVMAREERNLWHSAAQRLKDELAAAKAASRCPVRVLNIFECVCESDRYIELRTDAEADTFADWLRDRMKDTLPAT